ncbi:uncharacterized protein si:dkey-247k7.2 [Danio aesculapii]|uniref:uncharacterized protein si:dkey-247k7.2 n=1 Tax=Danio aesculapii TaxID=1142201 RepID=UPI0024BF5037|nr:uncharacterized protein si:dkey-247k7.2 [Danio aesculapii]
MAQFVQLAAVLSLCLLAAVVNAQDNGPGQNSYGEQVCTHYTNSGTMLLDGTKFFDLMRFEFGGDIQTLTPMVTQQWMQDADTDHDNRLNFVECSIVVQRVHDSVHRPPQI